MFLIYLNLSIKAVSLSYKFLYIVSKFLIFSVHMNKIFSSSQIRISLQIITTKLEIWILENFPKENDFIKLFILLPQMLFLTNNKWNEQSSK